MAKSQLRNVRKNRAGHLIELENIQEKQTWH